MNKFIAALAAFLFAFLPVAAMAQSYNNFASPFAGGLLVTTGAATASTGILAIQTDGTNAIFRTPTAYYFENGTGSGYVGVNGGAYTNLSDARFKRDIHRVPYGLDSVMRLKPSAFTWKDSGRHDLGFIAQDVRNVLPELVSVMNPKTGTLGINYAGIAPVLAQAIQDQQHEIGILRIVAIGEPPLILALAVGVAICFRRKRLS